MKLSRNKDSLIFHPERDGDFRVYSEEEKLIASGNSAVSLPNDPFKHRVYRIAWDDQSSYIAEVALIETKIVNFRDLGGYVNHEGRQVKYNCFYRSAPIVARDEDAKNYLENLSMKTILDLRSDHEVKQAPDDILNGCTYICKGAIAGNEMEHAGNFDFKELLNTSGQKDLQKYMMITYEKLPFQNEAYQIMFDRILAQAVPLVFHCSAGKDRTGFGAYLILKTLGVADNIIMDDYLASNIYRKEENDKMLEKAGKYGEIIGKLMNVYPAYLQSSIDKIYAKYATFEDYLLEEYNIDQEKIATLRNRYLY